MADSQTPSVAPSDALLSLVLSRAVDAVGRIVDPVRVEEDAVVRLVANYADVESAQHDALVEGVARRVGSGIGAADVAEHIDLSDLAQNIDHDEIASNFDASDIASHIDLSDLAGEVDLSDLAGYLARDIAVEDVASHIDVSDVASNIDLSELAGNIDLSDLAAEVEVDPAEVAACLDLDDLASRAMAGFTDLDERLAAVEKATGPLAAMDGAIDLHRERLVALEERVAALAAPASGSDLVNVQIGPALPAAAPAAPSADVLGLVVDRTVASLLAALNAAAAEGRL